MPSILETTLREHPRYLQSIFPYDLVLLVSKSTFMGTVHQIDLTYFEILL